MRYFLILLLFPFLNLYAQNSGYIRTQTGYGYNVLKAPNFYIDSEEEEIEAFDLQHHGFFTDIAAKYQKKWKKGKNRWRCYTLGNLMWFPQNPDLNRYKATANFQYKRKIKKYQYLTTNLSLLHQNRRDNNQTDELFEIISVNIRTAMRGDLSINISKNTKIGWEGLIGKKDFHQEDGPFLGYRNAIGQLSIQHFWKNQWKNKNYVEGNLGLEKRWYERVKELEIAPDVWDIDATFWERKVLRVKLKSYFQLNKHWAMRSILNFNQQSEERVKGIHYNEIAFSNAFIWKKRKSEFTWTPRVAYRSYYQTLSDNDSDEMEPLRSYVYFNSSLRWKQSLTKNLDIVVDASFIRRISSVDDETRLSFRTYSTGLIKMGVLWSF